MRVVETTNATSRPKPRAWLVAQGGLQGRCKPLGRCRDLHEARGRDDAAAEGENQRLKRDLESIRKDLKRATAHFEGAEKRAYDRAKPISKAKLEKRPRLATRSPLPAMKEMRELAPVEAKQEHTKEEAQEALDEFREEHPWYDKANLANATEVEINARLFYDRMVDRHIDKTKDMPPAEFFAYIADLTLDKYPALKGKPAAGSLQRGRGGNWRPSPGHGADLGQSPRRAKRQYTRFIDRGLLGVKSSGDTAKDLEASRKYYARSHDWKGYEA
jgi:hypothetical protein